MLTVTWQGTFTRGTDRRTYCKTFGGLMESITQQMRDFVDLMTEKGWTLRENETTNIKVGPECHEPTDD